MDNDSYKEFIVSREADKYIMYESQLRAIKEIINDCHYDRLTDHQAIEKINDLLKEIGIVSVINIPNIGGKK